MGSNDLWKRGNGVIRNQHGVGLHNAKLTDSKKEGSSSDVCYCDSLSGAFVSESRKIVMEQNICFNNVCTNVCLFLTGKPIKVELRQVKSTKQEFRVMIN